jgi:transposase-like protein
MHKEARLTPIGRERMVMTVVRRQTLQAVGGAVGICPRIIRKWVKRYQEQGAAVRDGIAHREALEHADRIVRRQHRDRRPEADARGPRGDGGERHVGRGDGETGAVVLAEADDVEAEPVGQHPLFDYRADGPGLRLRRAALTGGHLPAGIAAAFDGLADRPRPGPPWGSGGFTPA